jgi:hypothetical protein
VKDKDRVEKVRRIGCGVEGCLTAAMVLFTVLMILMLGLVFMRLGPRF